MGELKPNGRVVVQVRQRSTLQLSRADAIRRRIQPALPERIELLGCIGYLVFLLWRRFGEWEGLEGGGGSVAESRFGFA